MVLATRARSSIFRDTLNRLRELKQVKDEGGFNSIPFGIPSLDKHTVGIMKGMIYAITASSGIGKSQLTKLLGIIQPYKFIKEHPNLGIKLKIIYFALEESKEEFMLGLIAHRLKEVYNISIGILELQSLGDRNLSVDILNKIASCEEYFAELEECLEIVDNVFNPYGLYLHVKNYSIEHGIHYYRKLRNEDSGDIITMHQYAELPGDIQQLYCYSHYIPTDPKEIVIVIPDHISLLSAEKAEDSNTQHKAMGKWSADYSRKQISKNFKYCIIQVQQQEASKEKLEFNYSGENIIQKLLPSLDGLANNKECGRDYLTVLGLFAPERYKIPKYMGYDITLLRDNFRSLLILKNRYGTPNLELPMWFNGENNTFIELKPPDSEETRKLYEVLRNQRRT